MKKIVLLSCMIVSIYSMENTQIEAIKYKIISYAQTSQERNQAITVLEKVKNIQDLNRLLKKSGSRSYSHDFAESKNFDFPHNGD